jgi:hypothetical protein
LLVVALTTVAFFKKLDLSSAENKIYILLERMKIRESKQHVCESMVTNVLSQLAIKHKLRALYETLKQMNRDTWNLKERKATEKKIQKLETKKAAFGLELKHLINSKIKSNKKIDGINTTGYIMETIIDDICHAIQNIDDTGQTILDIINELNMAVKKDEILVDGLKKKIKSDLLVKKRKDN